MNDKEAYRADESACNRRSAAWNLVPLVVANAAIEGKEQCMRERGWMADGFGYKRPEDPGYMGCMRERGWAPQTDRYGWDRIEPVKQ